MTTLEELIGFGIQSEDPFTAPALRTRELAQSQGGEEYTPELYEAQLLRLLEAPDQLEDAIRLRIPVATEDIPEDYESVRSRIAQDVGQNRYDGQQTNFTDQPGTLGEGDVYVSPEDQEALAQPFGDEGIVAPEPLPTFKPSKSTNDATTNYNEYQLYNVDYAAKLEAQKESARVEATPHSLRVAEEAQGYATALNVDDEAQTKKIAAARAAFDKKFDREFKVKNAAAYTELEKQKIELERRRVANELELRKQLSIQEAGISQGLGSNEANELAKLGEKVNPKSKAPRDKALIQLGRDKAANIDKSASMYFADGLPEAGSVLLRNADNLDSTEKSDLEDSFNSIAINSERQALKAVSKEAYPSNAARDNALAAETRANMEIGFTQLGQKRAGSVLLDKLTESEDRDLRLVAELAKKSDQTNVVKAIKEAATSLAATARQTSEAGIFDQSDSIGRKLAAREFANPVLDKILTILPEFIPEFNKRYAGTGIAITPDYLKKSLSLSIPEMLMGRF